MSVKIYTPSVGQSLFDISMAVYSDIRGLSAIISMNPGLDPSADDYFGTPIQWDDALIFRPSVQIVPMPERPSDPILVGQNQTIFDLAIQIYGDIRKLEHVIRYLDSPGQDVPLGMMLHVEKTDNPAAGRYKVSTGGIVDDPGGNCRFNYKLNFRFCH